MKTIKKCKKGDKVRILDGSFENLIRIIKSFDQDSLRLLITIILFEEKYDIEHNGKFEIFKEDKDEK